MNRMLSWLKKKILWLFLGGVALTATTTGYLVLEQPVVTIEYLECYPSPDLLKKELYVSFKLITENNTGTCKDGYLYRMTKKLTQPLDEVKNVDLLNISDIYIDGVKQPQKVYKLNKNE